MNRKREAEFSSYITVKDLSNANAGITNSVPNFASNTALLVSVITQLQLVSEQRMMSRTGNAATKSALRKSLINLTIESRNKLNVYANFTNNLVLIAQLAFTKSDLNHEADSRVRERGQTIYDLIQTNLAALPTYVLNATTQTALLNAINLYAASLGKTGVARTDGVRLKRQEDDLFAQLAATVRAMDLSLEVIKSTQPLFYVAFKSAKKVIVKSQKLSIRGNVYDEETGQAVENAIISLYSDANGPLNNLSTRKPNLEKKTTKLGSVQVQSFPAGYCLIKIKKNGFEDTELTIAINNTERTEFRIGLKKVKTK